MQEKRNVFLTSLSNTRHRLDIDYFVCDSDSGTLTYTNGISVAEAGIKYILSREVIDEIIVLGPADGAAPEETASCEIAGMSLGHTLSLAGMSEYAFLRYRLTEYLNQMDFEMLDIKEKLTADKAEQIKRKINDFRKDYTEAVSLKNLFARLCADRKLLSAFEKEVLSGCSDDERKWIKHHLFTEMDSYLKMHILSENHGTRIRYIPIEREGIMDIGSITRIVRETMTDDVSEIDLFLDMQGLGVTDGNALISTFMLLNKKTGYRCNLCGLINSDRNPSAFAGKVMNVLKSYEIQQFITGIDTFLEYGKDRMLKEYWQTRNIEDSDIERMFNGMDCIDEGITLCNIDLIAAGIGIVRNVIRHPALKSEERSIYSQILINAIASDYGKLLEGKNLSIPELLEWGLRKGLYQQVLTIIESRIPEDIVRRGIYYYARNKEDIDALMKDFNVLYWNEQAKMRWAFDDVDHYFIKNYGRNGIDYRQKPDKVAQDFARLKIMALHKQTEEVRPAYSQLGNDDMLYELLLGYYRIGNLRNQVNHAIVNESDLADGSIKRKDSREDLHYELDKFIKLYAAVCRRTHKKEEPLFLSSGKMKAYTRRHELQPLTEKTDLTINDTYTCQFNGKEVLINISLLKPQEDQQPE